MFARAKSANASSLRKYRQHLELESAGVNPVAIRSSELDDCSERCGASPQTGDWVKVVNVLGQDRRGLKGREGEVIGTVSLPMFNGQVSCTVRFSDGQNNTFEKTFDAADLLVMGEKVG